jgi:hypothetical protein
VTPDAPQATVRNRQRHANRKQLNRLEKNVAEEGKGEGKTMRTLNGNKKVNVI